MVTTYPQCSSSSVGPFNQLVDTLLTTILALHCNLSLPVKWPDDYGHRAIKTGSYDYIVIGGGTAGSVVAGRLAENPKNRVLVLEAGGDPPIESEIPGLALGLHHTKYDWQYPTVSNGLSCLAMKKESCTWNRGKMLGGTGSMNSMHYIRGVPGDYDYWEYQGNPLWSWIDVVPYFKKSEDFRGDNKFGEHGTNGPMTVESFRLPKYDQYMILAAAKELGHNQIEDFVHDNYFGFGFVYGTVKDGRRMSSGKAFLQKPKKNLDILKNSIAERINFSGRNRVESVGFVHDGKRLNVTVKREVIVSAGAIESAKLLMLSGIGPSTHLRTMNIPVVSDLPVGHNLMDHVMVTLFLRVQYKYSPNPDIRMLDAIYSQLVHRSGSYGGVTLDVHGFVATKKSSQYPNIQYIFQPILNVTQENEQLKDSIRRSILRQIETGDRIFRVGVILLRPQSRGLVMLHSKNYRDKPKIIPNSFQKDADMKTMIQGIKKLVEFQSTRTFWSVHGKFLRVALPPCDDHKYKSWRYWECYAKYMTSSVNHPAGTAKMGPDTDYTSVVDSELRVRGVRGVRVIDASVMPTPVTGDTNVATIMIGERGVDFVQEKGYF